MGICKLFFFWLISNKFYWYKKWNTLVHKECKRGQQFKYKNYKNQGNQEKKRMIGFTYQPTNPIKFEKKITWGLIWISHYLQSTYYFSPSKVTTLSNGEQLTKYDHFNDDQGMCKLFYIPNKSQITLKFRNFILK